MATDKINVIAGYFNAFDFESLSITETSTPLTEAKYKRSDGSYAKRVLITCENAQIRYKYNGDDPTSSSGHILNPNEHLIIIGSGNIRNFRATRTGSSSGKMEITYEQ